MSPFYRPHDSTQFGESKRYSWEESAGRKRRNETIAISILASDGVTGSCSAQIPNTQWLI